MNEKKHDIVTHKNVVREEKEKFATGRSSFGHDYDDCELFLLTAMFARFYFGVPRIFIRHHSHLFAELLNRRESFSQNRR